MEQKKTPTMEQMSEYRQWCQNLCVNATQSKVEAFEEEYDVFTVVYEENRRKGVKDVCGKVLILALFDDIAYTFADRYRSWAVPVVNDGKIAFVAPDGMGTLLSGFDYDSVNFSEGYYIVVRDGKQGLATVGGQLIVPAEMDELLAPVNDLLAFKKNGKYGFAMLGHDLRTEAIYEDYDIGAGEYLEVVNDGMTGYIDKDGCFTVDEDERFFYAGWD